MSSTRTLNIVTKLIFQGTRLDFRKYPFCVRKPRMWNSLYLHERRC